MSPMEDYCATRCKGFVDCFVQQSENALGGLGTVLPYLLVIFAVLVFIGCSGALLAWLFARPEVGK